MDLYVDSAKSIDDIYAIPWKMYVDNNKKCDKATNLKVLIICNPCMGFGDIVYGMKFNQYLKDWYHCDIKIATTNPSNFKQLGMTDNNLYLLKSKSTISQCRKVKLMKFYNTSGKLIDVPKVDLIFIAPLTADFEVDYKDIKKLIPYSNRLNTFFLSEYNDSTRKHIDFHTGIGSGRFGMFLTDTPRGNKLSQNVNEYSLIYIADSISRASSCYSSFIEMVVKKYHKIYTEFDIVVPEWIAIHIKTNKKLLHFISNYYDDVQIVTKKTKNVDFEIANTLYIRGDIFPLRNNDMIQLIRYSVKDILLTGDQSITDALSCCADKNIFYQIAPWKENFAKQLTKQLPNIYLKTKKKSCGTIKAIKYKSNYSDFKETWDFRILARPKMDAIFLAALKRKKNNNIGERTRLFESIILSSKTLSSFDKKYNNLSFTSDNDESIQKYEGESNSINDFFDKIFIINLHDKTERYNKVIKQFHKTGIKYERFNAVDGRCKDDECKTKKKQFEKKYNVKIRKKINIPAASLVLGTIKILRDQVKNKWSRVLICEDDIEFTKQILNKFEKGIKDLPNKWDVLYLGCGNSCGTKGISDTQTSSTKYKTSLSIVSDEYDWYTNHKNDLRVPCENCTEVKDSKYLSYPSAPGGTWAYSYSLKGAKKMLKFIDNTIDDHIDQIVIKAVADEQITAVSFDPPIIMHEAGAFRPDSDIPWEW